MAKSNCWNQFLEKAEGKDIFKAFTYTKQKRIERLPIIIYSDRNNERKNKITFNQKCDVFLTSLFYLPPASELSDWSNYKKKSGISLKSQSIRLKRPSSLALVRKRQDQIKYSFLLFKKSIIVFRN